MAGTASSSRPPSLCSSVDPEIGCSKGGGREVISPQSNSLESTGVDWENISAVDCFGVSGRTSIDNANGDGSIGEGLKEEAPAAENMDLFTGDSSSP